MSLILDALKKLDREKAAKRHGTMDIASGILRQERTRRRRIIVPVAAVLFTAIAAAVVTYHWTGVPSLTPVAVQTAPAVPAPAVQAAPALQPVAPVVKQEPATEPKPVPAAEPARKQITATPPPAAEAPRAAERSRARSPAAMEPARATAKGVDASSSGRSRLKVSGIVWQEERSARRAFVNDVPVREGDVVQGAKVVEIHAGHVRFSRGDEFFEVRLFE
jgi:general secretion pathway protein B